jgi:hypothetical protein
MEMDSTTVILPKHTGTVDVYGNILIYPDGYKAPKVPKAAAKVTRKPAQTARKPAKAARKPAKGKK